MTTTVQPSGASLNKRLDYAARTGDYSRLTDAEIIATARAVLRVMLGDPELRQMVKASMTQQAEALVRV